MFKAFAFVLISALALSAPAAWAIPPAVLGTASLPTAVSAQAATDLPAAEAYQYAAEPYRAARNAPNDFTEADRWAYQQTISRASQQCQLLSSKTLTATGMAVKSVLAADGPAELLALSKLCILGQDWDPAREALFDYLASPGIKDKRSAYFLMIEVFLNQHDMIAAESDLDSLVGQYPYDAQIHLAIDWVIDATEKYPQLDVVGQLDTMQAPYILKALADGGTLSSKTGAVGPLILFEDGLRCADDWRRRGEGKRAAAYVTKLQAALFQLSARHTLSSMQVDQIHDAFSRYALTGQSLGSLGLENLKGEAFTLSGKVIPRTIAMTGRPHAIVAISLGAPTSASILEQLVAYLPRNSAGHSEVSVLAITSYQANSGVNQPSKAVVTALKALRHELPARVTLLLVPQARLSSLFLDAYPSEVAVDAEGNILYVSISPASTANVERVIASFKASH